MPGLDNKYKKLEINLDMMRGTVELYCSTKGCHLVDVQIKESNQNIDYHVVCNDMDFSFSLYKSNGNRYSISYKKGNNETESKEFADFLVQRLGNVNKENQSNKGFKISLTSEDFLAFIDLLCDDDISILSHSDSDNESQYKLKSKLFRDEIMVHYYKTTHNIFIQGRRLQLFNKATDILSSKCDFVEVVNAEIRYDKVSISSDVVIEQMQKSLGNVYDFLTTTQKAIMSNAFKFYRIDIELDDYSVLVQPMARAMEGFIYKLLELVGIEVEDNDGVGHFFRKEDEKTNPLKMKSVFVSKINNDVIVNSLNMIYNWYYNNRHKISHSTESDTTTYVIKNREIADTKFKESVDLYRNIYDRIVEAI